MEKPSSPGALSRSKAHIASITSSSLISCVRRIFSLAVIYELKGAIKASFNISSDSLSAVYNLQKWGHASSLIPEIFFLGGFPSGIISLALFFNSRALVFLWKKEVCWSRDFSHMLLDFKCHISSSFLISCYIYLLRLFSFSRCQSSTCRSSIIFIWCSKSLTVTSFFFSGGTYTSLAQVCKSCLTNFIFDSHTKVGDPTYSCHHIKEINYVVPSSNTHPGL